MTSTEDAIDPALDLDLDLVLEREVDVPPKHGNAALKDEQEKVGFHEGWGSAVDQLVELARTF